MYRTVYANGTHKLISTVFLLSLHGIDSGSSQTPNHSPDHKFLFFQPVFILRHYSRHYHI